MSPGRILGVGALVAVLGPILALVGLQLTAVAVNQRHLGAVASTVAGVDFPEGVALSPVHATVGLQACCSNHCDFFAGREVRSPMAVEALREALVLPEGVELIAPPPPDDFWWSIRGFRELAGEPSVQAEDVAYLMAFEQEYSGFGFDWDLRCH